MLAALVNPRLRRALAEIITEADPPLTAAERRDAHRILEQSGMLTPGLQLDERRLRELLVAGRAEEAQGVDRWLRTDGRIDRWPKAAADRQRTAHLGRRAVVGLGRSARREGVHPAALRLHAPIRTRCDALSSMLG